MANNYLDAYNNYLKNKGAKQSAPSNSSSSGNIPRFSNTFLEGYYKYKYGEDGQKAIDQYYADLKSKEEEKAKQQAFYNSPEYKKAQAKRQLDQQNYDETQKQNRINQTAEKYKLTKNANEDIYNRIWDIEDRTGKDVPLYVLKDLDRQNQMKSYPIIGGWANKSIGDDIDQYINNNAKDNDSKIDNNDRPNTNTLTEIPGFKDYYRGNLNFVNDLSSAGRLQNDNTRQAYQSGMSQAQTYNENDSFTKKLPHQIVETIGNMAPQLILGGKMTKAAGLNPNALAGKAVSLSPIGISSYGNAYQNAKDQGVSEGKANLYGLANGVTQMGSEMLFMPWGQKALTGALDNTVKQTFRQSLNSLAKDAGGEAIEEGIGGVGQYLSDKYILGKDVKFSDPDNLRSIAEQMALGGITGGLMGGGQVIDGAKNSLNPKTRAEIKAQTQAIEQEKAKQTADLKAQIPNIAAQFTVENDGQRTLDPTKVKELSQIYSTQFKGAYPNVQQFLSEVLSAEPNVGALTQVDETQAQAPQNLNGNVNVQNNISQVQEFAPKRESMLDPQNIEKTKQAYENLADKNVYPTFESFAEEIAQNEREMNANDPNAAKMNIDRFSSQVDKYKNIQQQMQNPQSSNTLSQSAILQNQLKAQKYMDIQRQLDLSPQGNDKAIPDGHTTNYNTNKDEFFAYENTPQGRLPRTLPDSKVYLGEGQTPLKGVNTPERVDEYLRLDQNREHALNSMGKNWDKRQNYQNNAEDIDYVTSELISERNRLIEAQQNGLLEGFDKREVQQAIDNYDLSIHEMKQRKTQLLQGKKMTKEQADQMYNAPYSMPYFSEQIGSDEMLRARAEKLDGMDAGQSALYDYYNGDFKNLEATEQMKEQYINSVIEPTDFVSEYLPQTQANRNFLSVMDARAQGLRADVRYATAEATSPEEVKDRLIKTGIAARIESYNTLGSVISAKINGDMEQFGTRLSQVEHNMNQWLNFLEKSPYSKAFNFNSVVEELRYDFDAAIYFIKIGHLDSQSDIRYSNIFSQLNYPYSMTLEGMQELATGVNNENTEENNYAKYLYANDMRVAQNLIGMEDPNIEANKHLAKVKQEGRIQDHVNDMTAKSDKHFYEQDDKLNQFLSEMRKSETPQTVSSQGNMFNEQKSEMPFNVEEVRAEIQRLQEAKAQAEHDAQIVASQRVSSPIAQEIQAELVNRANARVQESDDALSEFVNFIEQAHAQQGGNMSEEPELRPGAVYDAVEPSFEDYDLSDQRNFDNTMNQAFGNSDQISRMLEDPNLSQYTTDENIDSQAQDGEVMHSDLVDQTSNIAGKKKKEPFWKSLKNGFTRQYKNLGTFDEKADNSDYGVSGKMSNQIQALSDYDMRAGREGKKLQRAIEATFYELKSLKDPEAYKEMAEAISALEKSEILQKTPNKGKELFGNLNKESVRQALEKYEGARPEVKHAVQHFFNEWFSAIDAETQAQAQYGFDVSDKKLVYNYYFKHLTAQMNDVIQSSKVGIGANTNIKSRHGGMYYETDPINIMGIGLAEVYDRTETYKLLNSMKEKDIAGHMLPDAIPVATYNWGLENGLNKEDMQGMSVDGIIQTVINKKTQEVIRRASQSFDVNNPTVRGENAAENLKAIQRIVDPSGMYGLNDIANMLKSQNRELLRSQVGRSFKQSLQTKLNETLGRMAAKQGFSVVNVSDYVGINQAKSTSAMSKITDTLIDKGYNEYLVDDVKNDFMILPNNLANEVNRMFLPKQKADGFKSLLQAGLGWYKGWSTSRNPLKAIKYYARNMFGDVINSTTELKSYAYRDTATDLIGKMRDNPELFFNMYADGEEFLKFHDKAFPGIEERYDAWYVNHQITPRTAEEMANMSKNQKAMELQLIVDLAMNEDPQLSNEAIESLNEVYPYEDIEFLKVFLEQTEGTSRNALDTEGFQKLKDVKFFTDAIAKSKASGNKTSEKVLSTIKRIDEKNPITWVLNKMEQGNNLRELKARLAPALYYYDQMKAGRLVLGATDKNFVKNFETHKNLQDGRTVFDKKKGAILASRMGQDTIGNYKDLDEYSRTLRRTILPFVSFPVSAVKKNANLLVNSFDTDRVISDLKAKGLEDTPMNRVGQISQNIAYHFGPQIALGTILPMLWNMLVMGDKEEKLPEYMKNSPHIILPGMLGEDHILVFSDFDVLSSALEFTGIGSPWSWGKTARDINDGRESFVEALMEIPKNQFENILNQVHGLIKLPVEEAIGYSLFPSPFEPTPIHDRIDYIFKALGAGNLVDFITQDPTGKNGFLENVAEGMVNTIDLKKAVPNDYKYNIAPEVNDALGIENMSVQQKMDDKDKMKSYIFAYLQKGNVEKAQAMINEYVSKGGSLKELEDSLARKDPDFGYTPTDRQYASMANWTKDTKAQANGDMSKTAQDGYYKEYKSDKRDEFLREDEYNKLVLSRKYYNDLKTAFEQATQGISPEVAEAPSSSAMKSDFYSKYGVDPDYVDPKAKPKTQKQIAKEQKDAEAYQEYLKEFQNKRNSKQTYR